MPDADFMPLRPRRHGSAKTPAYTEETEPVSGVESAPAPPSQPAESPTLLPLPEHAVAPLPHSLEEASAEEQRLEAPPEPPNEPEDEEERAAGLRDEAIRFASIATARALRTTLARDAGALTRYVDDALQACGRVTRARVRLHPADAALYRPRRDVEIIADASASRGDVVIETDAGIVSATIEERAALLARAAAHA